MVSGRTIRTRSPVESTSTWPFFIVESGRSSVPLSKIALLPVGLAVAVQRVVRSADRADRDTPLAAVAVAHPSSGERSQTGRSKAAKGSQGARRRCLRTVCIGLSPRGGSGLGHIVGQEAQLAPKLLFVLPPDVRKLLPPPLGSAMRMRMLKPRPSVKNVAAFLSLVLGLLFAVGLGGGRQSVSLAAASAALSPSRAPKMALPGVPISATKQAADRRCPAGGDQRRRQLQWSTYRPERTNCKSRWRALHRSNRSAFGQRWPAQQRRH